MCSLQEAMGQHWTEPSAEKGFLFSCHVCIRRLLAARPAERHTAAGAGAGELCDAARCFRAASGDAAPRG